MLNASRNSDVRTEYATGVSLRAVVMRPPASELAATNPTSDSALTLNGSSLTVCSVLALAGAVGAVWAGRRESPKVRTNAAAAAAQRDRVGFMGISSGCSASREEWTQRGLGREQGSAAVLSKARTKPAAVMPNSRTCWDSGAMKPATTRPAKFGTGSSRITTDERQPS